MILVLCSLWCAVEAADVSDVRTGVTIGAASPATLLRFDPELNVVGDLMLEGLIANQSVAFTIPRAWALRADPVIELRFDHSGALLPERSLLTVRVNDRAIASVALDGSNTTDGRLRAPIARSLLRDYNTLQVEAVQHVSADCEDPFDPSLWTRILRTSSIEVAAEPAPIVPELLDFPFPFFDARGYGPTRIALVDTGELLPSQLATIGEIGLTLGRHVAYRLLQVEPPVTRLEELRTHGLVIGLTGRHALVGQLVPVGLASGQGYVGVVPAPHDPSLAVLVVAGADEEGLGRAVAALSGQDRAPMLAGGGAVVTRVTVDSVPPNREEFRPVPRDQPAFKFAELGFEDRSVRGYYAETLRIPVQLEGDAEPSADGLVRLHYAHSALVDPRISAIEVRMNGVVLRSRHLDEDERPGFMDVELPREVLERKNDLEVFFHLFPVDFDACRRVTDRQLWATVFADSTIRIARDHWAEMPDLARLETGMWPFSLDAVDGGTTIVLGDAPTAADASAALQLAAELGRTSTVARPLLTVTTAAGRSPTGSHLVLLSRPGAPHAVYERLLAAGTLTLGGEAPRALGLDGSLLTAAVGGPYATVEEAMNPAEPTHGILAVRGTDLADAVRAVTSPARVGQLAGNAAILPPGGPSRPLDVVARTPVGERSMRRFLQASLTDLWPFTGAAVPFAALVAAWVIRRWARARGGRT